VAPLAPPADREAAHHLGLQDPLPGRPLPAQRREDHLRRRRPDCQGRPNRAARHGPQGRAVRLHALLRLQAGDGRLPLLEDRLLANASGAPQVPHQRSVRGRSEEVQEDCGGRSAARAVPGSESGSE